MVSVGFVFELEIDAFLDKFLARSGGHSINVNVY